MERRINVSDAHTANIPIGQSTGLWVDWLQCGHVYSVGEVMKAALQ